MPDPARPVRYVAGVDTLLVAGTAVAGLCIGGALDPVGQRLAERSRLEDQRRRADSRNRPADETADAGRRAARVAVDGREDAAAPARSGPPTPTSR